MGDPQYGWFIRENPIKMDDLGGTPISGNHYLVRLYVSSIPLGAVHLPAVQ